jgi:hypothetical protein
MENCQQVNRGICYDYSHNRSCFVTLATHRNQRLFGTIVNGKVQLNGSGEIVKAEWLRCAGIEPEFRLDFYQVMPDYFHAIVWIQQLKGRMSERICSPRERYSRLLDLLLSGFKAATETRINQLLNTPGRQIWEPYFQDRTIKDDSALYAIRKHILNVPRFSGKLKDG